MRACVIFNPNAQGGKAQRFLRHLGDLGGAYELRPTPQAGAGWALAAAAVREGFDTIVAAGGDGTVNEVLNGLTAEPDGCARARLAILPIGTVNVFARELGLPLRLSHAWQTIRRGRETMIDLPQMEFLANGRRQHRCFIQMAGAGWDARAIEKASWKLKKKIGQFAYIVAGLQLLAEKQPELKLTTDSGSGTGELVIIGNGRFYGGPIPIFSKADHRDGLLDVCLFPKVDWFVLLRYAWAYASRGRFWMGREKYFQTREFQIEGAARTPVELDGENVGHLPATGTIRHRSLRVIVP